MSGYWTSFNRYQKATVLSERMSHLDDAIENYPDPLAALAERAVLHCGLGNFKLALSDADRAIPGVLKQPDLATHFLNDTCYAASLSALALGKDPSRYLAHIPDDKPHFQEARFETPAVHEIQDRATADTVLGQYLIAKRNMRRDYFSWEDAIASAVTEENLVFQVGAMDGVRFDPVYEVIQKTGCCALLVEPIPEMFELLKRNYASYPNVRFANVAIGLQSGTQPMYRVPVETVERGLFEEWALGVSSLRAPSPLSVISGHTEIVNVRTLTFADFKAEYKLDHFDVLQVDTEGYDWNVVQQIDLAAHGCRFARAEFLHLTLADRIKLYDHLRNAGMRVTCGPHDIWARVSGDSLDDGER